MSSSSVQASQRLSEIFRAGTASEDSSADHLLKNKKIIVYGAGNGFIAFHHAVLDRLHLKPALVLDNKFKSGETFHGVPARSLADHSPTREERENSVVVITVGSEAAQKTIVQHLRTAGFAHVVKASDLYEFNIHHVPRGLAENGPDFYLQNRGKIEAAFELMADALSRQVFCAVMKTYLSRVPEPVPHHPAEEQYFPSDVPLQKGYARFIHCGAYQGDTVRQLQARHGKIEALACFEPDADNFRILADYLKEHGGEIAQHLTAFPCGVFDRETQLPFSSDRLLSSSLFDPGKAMIQCVALDDVLPNFRPTFVSMDIEGAETEALSGATRLIKGFAPDLGISVYHFPNHLWEIPAFLHQLKPEYRMFVRNYSGFTYETILYATAPKP